MSIHIYTDGSCINNPGYGGWAFCVIGDIEICKSGGEPKSTNNRMELIAVIEAIKYICKDCTIHTDSQLIMKCANGEWKRKNNLDLWKIYDNLTKNKKIEWEWVRGHDGNKYNELVDKLAKKEAKNMKKYYIVV